MSVLYFHGFASSPKSQKLVALQAILSPRIELNAPDLNVPSFEKLSFEAMVQLGVERGRAVPPRASWEARLAPWSRSKSSGAASWLR